MIKTRYLKKNVKKHFTNQQTSRSAQGILKDKMKVVKTFPRKSRPAKRQFIYKTQV